MITLTIEAAERIQQQLDRRGRGLGIRISVRTTGCSGLAYQLEFVDEPLAEDTLVEDQGVCVWIAPQSRPYLEGAEMIWTRQGLNEGFEFVNPQEKGRCGCGESFRV